MTPPQQTRKGQSLVEFCLLLPLFLSSLALMLVTGIKAIIPYLLSLDVYDLARAHLYGIDQSSCAASSLWPRSFIDVRIDCSAMPQVYVAEAFLKWNSSVSSLGRIFASLWGDQ
jgi:hypothetical protein